jgi:hypothetical protein
MLLLDHVPEADRSERLAVPPTQVMLVPVIADMVLVLIVTGTIAEQPVLV